MFPTELMLIRRRKNGLVLPVFLTRENTQYCTDVISIFQSGIGKTSGEIDKEIKELESRSENHKIVRALALLIMRKSSFVPPSMIPAPEIRDYLFRKSMFPAYRPEEREAILRDAAEHFGVTPAEIVAGMYGDKETDQVMESCYRVDEDSLAKEFNLEMLETLISKSTTISVRNIADWHDLSTRARIAGLGVEIIYEGLAVREIRIGLPVAMRKNRSTGYSPFSETLKFVLSRPTWSIEAHVTVENKSWGRMDPLLLQLNESASFYLPENLRPLDIQVPQWASISRKPVNAGGKQFFPCFETGITGKLVYIFISGEATAKHDTGMYGDLEKSGIGFVMVSLNSTGHPRADRWIDFKGSINWDALREFIAGTRKERKQVTAPGRSTKLENEIDPGTIEELRENIDKLYPDSGRIIDYIESRGLVANRVLNALGYRVKWKGLDMIVVR